MDNILLIFISMSLIAFGLRIWAPAQYLAVGWLVEAGVRAAEQRYKETEGQVDRRKLANSQIDKVLWRCRIRTKKKPTQLQWLVDLFIDAAITRLSKTPKFDTEDPAISGVGVVDKSI